MVSCATLLKKPGLKITVKNEFHDIKKELWKIEEGCEILNVMPISAFGNFVRRSNKAEWFSGVDIGFHLNMEGFLGWKISVAEKIELKGFVKAKKEEIQAFWAQIM